MLLNDVNFKAKSLKGYDNNLQIVVVFKILILVDDFELVWLRKKKRITVEKLIEIRKFLTEEAVF